MRAAGWSERRRLAVAIAVLALVAAALYGDHVLQGAFYFDDWYARERVMDAGSPRFIEAIGRFASFSAHRPGYVLYAAAVFTGLGSHGALYGVVAVGLAVAVSGLLLGVLRRLGLPSVHATVVAVLALAWPFGDATRLWASAAYIDLAVTLFLAGLLLALSALRPEASRRPVRHALAVCCYAASMLTYEVTAPAIALAWAVYALAGARGRVLVARAAADIVSTVLVITLVTSGSPRGRPSAGDDVGHARTIAADALRLVGETLVPGWRPAPVAVVVAVAALALAGGVTVRRTRRADVRRASVVWLAALAGGLVLTAAAYAMYVPAEPYYRPLLGNIGSRVNGFAGLGLVLSAYAAIALAATLAAAPLPPGRFPATLMMPVVVAVMVGYCLEVRRDVRDWGLAWTQSQAVLASVERGARGLPAGTTLLTFGHPGFLKPDLPVFGAPWDLNAALRVDARPDLRARPVLAPWTTVRCAAHGIELSGMGYKPGEGARYGRAVFLDVASGRRVGISSLRDCRQAQHWFRPGPYVGAS